MANETYEFINKSNIRLSLNENPSGPEQIKPFPELNWSDFMLNRYLRQEDGPLLPAIAAYTGFPPEYIIAGNGGDEIIFNLVQALATETRTMLINPPTFGEYAQAADTCFVEAFEVRLADNFELDVDQIIATCKSENIDLVFICNPNNPTANLFSKEAIRTVLDNVQAYVVVDEAYYEFAGETMEDELKQYPKMIILRTLSKAFAAAGLRIGYALANPPVIKQIRSIQMPFNIGNVPQFLGAELLKNRDAFLANVAESRQERDRLITTLNQIPGLKAYDSFTNYIILDVGGSAITVVDYLADHGISVRDISKMDPRLAHMIRISVGLPEQNALLVSLLKQCRGEIFDGINQ